MFVKLTLQTGTPKTYPVWVNMAMVTHFLVSGGGAPVGAGPTTSLYFANNDAEKPDVVHAERRPRRASSR